MVGLDVLGHVVKNAKRLAPALAGAGGGEVELLDERGDLELPAFYDQMIERKLLGDKTGAGFYKKSAAPMAKSAWRSIGRHWNTILRSVPSFPRWRWRKLWIRSASGCVC